LNVQTETTTKIKMLIADDHPLFRQGLKHAFNEIEDIEIISEAGTATEVLDKVRSQEFSLILLDIAMPGKGGLELLKQLRNEFPTTPVLILSVYPENQYAIRFIRAGASGYLTKESSIDTLIQAVRKVAGGGKYASAQVTEKLAFDFLNPDKPPHETLSDREFQVFSMMASGKSLTEIAKELTLSVKTISTHRSRILDKMKLKNNAEMIHYAINQHLI